jgi:hypothetical protein
MRKENKDLTFFCVTIEISQIEQDTFVYLITFDNQTPILLNKLITYQNFQKISSQFAEKISKKYNKLNKILI